MKKLIKRIFRGKYYKNGESYVDTIVKVIICVVVGALLLTSVYAVAKSGLESAKNKVNDLLDYNPDGEDGPGGGDTSIPDGEDGPGGGDTSIPGGGDESEPEVPDLPQLAAPLIDIEGDTLSIIDEEGDADEFELYIDGEYTQDINAEPTTVFDLSVLSLEDGSHTIQCKAKAEGYQTSEFSNSVEYEVAAFAPYLTFQSVNSFTISVASPKWDGTMEYSTDTENWTAWDGSSISSVDGKVYLRGTGNTRVSSDSEENYSQFIISGTDVECAGNIETLLDWQTVVDGQHPEMGNCCFAQAFRNCFALITTPSLPATTLAEVCYWSMFYGCTALTTAPELPATTLARSCYDSMFYGCTALTTAPALSATNLAEHCYRSMFSDCTALTTAPALSATNLAEHCYRSMFEGCTSLTTAPALPATTLAKNCYRFMYRYCTSLITASSLPATTLAQDCYLSMFQGCTALTTAPTLPATTLAVGCYNGIFNGCTALTTAPALPATTLANYCYYNMFLGCTSLTTAPALPATTLADYCYVGMFNGCTNLKVSATQTGTYQHEWRIPTSGTISSTKTKWNEDMISGTGGTFTGDPAINTTYYLECMEPYLTFQSVNPFTIRVASPKWNGTMEYSTDTENWTTWDGSSISSVEGKVYLRGTENTRFSLIFNDEYDDYSEFVINGTNVECIGNIETLLDWQTVVDGQHPVMDDYCFAYAFYNCSSLITSPALPATTLANECYYRMFYRCTNLTTAPALPATTLSWACYYGMFEDCTNLITAPALSATTLAGYCYEYMFYGCTALTTAPALLPATTLADYCYHGMFRGCTALTTAPELPATTLATRCYSEMFQGCTNLKVSATQTGAYQCKWRIPTSGTISSTPLNWNTDMFANTGGTFTGDPVINTTYYLEYNPYLTFQSVNPFTISVASPKWNGTMEYSTDTENWTTWNGSSISSVDGKLYLRGTGNTKVSAQYEYSVSPFVISGTNVKCIGNIETLLDWQKVLNGEHPTMADYCYYGMFNGCTSLTTAPALPATTLANSCYFGMFSGCTALTTAPALLPATTLTTGCYKYMFYGCTSLTTAPALPATTLKTSCYEYMFYGCTSLTTAPALLPATTLAEACYTYMFNGCTALTTAPALPATTLANYCYEAMFYDCTALTTAPELPATTLARYCYYNMFYGCTNLKVSATQTGAYQYEWRIPTEGTISSTHSSWNASMFANTGGTFTGDPAINTTYYLEYPPIG